ncbi:MAG: bifunctional DNA primase/polymerase [Anaerolineae bacterium]
MLVNADRGLQQRLIAAAHGLLEQGLSVIPVQGGTEAHNAKIAAVRWSEYRSRFATAQEIHTWFAAQGFRGLAVVCGKLSQLTVVDFDEQEAYTAFAAQFPKLTQTLTIRSAIKQTPHLYWRTPFTVYGSRLLGGDLRAEGQYAVTAPTQIGKRAYTIQQPLPIITISPQDLTAALDFLQPSTAQDKTPHPQTQQDVITLYRSEAPAVGRNNALFQASKAARSNGWTLDATLKTLGHIHTQQQPSWKHKTETKEERQREAARTITSAFKRQEKGKTQDNTALPNSIREKLIQTQKTTTTARLLEALYAAQIPEFTEAQATEIARTHGIGRYSVIKALSGEFADIAGQRIFPIVIENNMICKETCGVRTSGRPARKYRLPEHAHLYQLLDAPESASDSISTTDLCSGKRYRMALHRTLLERRPGEYARGWLAARLGASVRTIQRYNRALNVVSTPVYSYSALDHDRVNHLPFCDERQPVTPGRWIEDASGKRYPALRALAHKLLKQNSAPIYVRRLPNHYAMHSEGQPLWRGSTGYTSDPRHVPASHALPSLAHSASPHVHECIHCGQLCFDEKLVCSGCRHKRNKPQSRITFDKHGKPRFPLRFHKTELTYDSIRHLLPDDFQRHVEIEDEQHKAWLETSDGKRYLTIQGLAYRLLRQYGAVYLVQRDRSVEMLYQLGVGLLRMGLHRRGKYFLRQVGLH